VNIRSLTSSLQYRGEVTGKRQTYSVFEGKRHYFVMSLSLAKRHAGNFNIVPVPAVDFAARRFRGRKKVTSKQLAAAGKGRGVASSLEALNVLYVLVATGRAKIDTRFHDKQLYFNVD